MPSQNQPIPLHWSSRPSTMVLQQAAVCHKNLPGSLHSSSSIIQSVPRFPRNCSLNSMFSTSHNWKGLPAKHGISPQGRPQGMPLYSSCRTSSSRAYCGKGCGRHLHASINEAQITEQEYKQRRNVSGERVVIHSWSFQAAA